ncbi:hypothetical protein [Porphyromonas cangingivalis]|uniref:MobA protein n=1 Tax=Porphyromonas cangingivalis TaxID=36874 RepID=A0A1T4KYC9_PORCN|nr:hypothetical protein [Porphyromonas cangingivalis]SJZ47436.1 hypothetical protein SAMN02745205_00917 [Porphyromonas cangingivalis]VEJ04041.1 Uncharacterised protein [Porphyromonas cangingivalis]
MKEKKTDKPDGRCATCPKWDRWHIRLPNPKDQQKVIDLYQRSGAKSKSDFVRARLLGETFKVITEDKSAEKYLRELSSIVTLTYKIGILYNEATKTLNSYHSIATAQRMLRKLEKYSALLIKLQLQAIKLTEEYADRFG